MVCTQCATELPLSSVAYFVQNIMVTMVENSARFAQIVRRRNHCLLNFMESCPLLFLLGASTDFVFKSVVRATRFETRSNPKRVCTPWIICCCIKSNQIKSNKSLLFITIRQYKNENFSFTHWLVKQRQEQQQQRQLYLISVHTLSAPLRSLSLSVIF